MDGLVHERQCSLNHPAVSIVEYCLAARERNINRLESSSTRSAILLHRILCCTSCGILSVNARCNTNDFRKYSQCSSDNRVFLIENLKFYISIHISLQNSVTGNFYMAVCFVAQQHETIYSNSYDQLAEPLSIAHSHTRTKP